MFLQRAINILKYRLERLLLRGTAARLLVIGALIGLISIGGGEALVSLDAQESRGNAVWWAFLRLTDPGYLGDDEGFGRRIVSSVLTVAGYVLFMGSLVAIMTQWLNNTIRDLERGFTPIAMRKHIVVLGETTRTAVIAQELFQSVARVRRFLSLYDTAKLRIVFLLEELDAEARYNLREKVGRAWREGSVAMRSGSPLHYEDLGRADVARAAAVLLPAEDVGPTEGAADARTIKTLLSIGQHVAEQEHTDQPLVVTELFDAQKLSIARRAYPGAVEIVCSDQLIGRLIALTVLNPGLARIFDELFAYGTGNEVHIVEAPQFVGKTLHEVQRELRHSIALGFVRRHERSFTPRLCPRPDEKMVKGESLVTLATDHEAALVGPGVVSDVEIDELPSSQAARPSGSLRVLIIGWSDRVPDLLSELGSHARESVSALVISSVEIDERREACSAFTLSERLEISHERQDVMRPEVIARCIDRGFDRIILVASDWVATGAQSDARTVLTFLMVRDELTKRKLDTPLVVELMDANNEPLVRAQGVDLLVSPLIIGRVLAHVTLRRELRAIYDDMFDANEASIRLRAPGYYGLTRGQRLPFIAIVEHVSKQGDVLLGTMSDGTFELNPDHEEEIRLRGATQLVILGR